MEVASGNAASLGPLRPTAHASKPLDLAMALEPLWVCGYRLWVCPLEPLMLPAFGRGAILRGGFGLSFRRLVCHDLALDCRACPLYRSCAYPEVFESAPPAGGTRLRNFTDIPRPFAFQPPLDPRTTFAPGEHVDFGFTVVGAANAHLPLFVAAFRNLADTGLGPRRARFVLASVSARDRDGQDRELYVHGSLRLDPDAPRLTAAGLARPGDEVRQELTLHFRTPVDIKDGGSVMQRPHFGPLLRRLRDRSAALAAFFGVRPLELDFKGLGTLAESVRLVEDRTRHVDVRRTSRRTGQRHDLGGFIGSAHYRGDAIGALMPLLRLGELLHVGRHAAFGNGMIELEEA